MLMGNVFTKRFLLAVSFCLLVVSAASARVTIETVYVGDVGNEADVIDVGGVDYGYWIGKYEVTAGQYCQFLNSVAASDTYGLYNTEMATDSWGCQIQRSGTDGSYAYSVAADYANRPVNYVSWGDCARFTNWLDRGQPTGAQTIWTTEMGVYDLYGATEALDLITVTRNPGYRWAIANEDEWYKAAYYNSALDDYYNFATSSDTPPDNIVADIDPGNCANYYIDDYTLALPYRTTEVGEFENSASPYGTFDQSGNVWELTESGTDSMRIARGGSYINVAVSLSQSMGLGVPSNHESPVIGFRMACVPEPTTLSLLLCALGAAAVRRGKF